MKRRSEVIEIANDTANPAFLFDLDGTLIDSVYQHVLAWHEALTAEHIELSIWRIHRKIGMSGGLFVRGLTREIGRELDEPTRRRLLERHAEAYLRRIGEARPLPGARALLEALNAARIPWAIATSGGDEVASRSLALLGLAQPIPLVTRDQVAHAKPNPDLFLAAARLLDVEIARAFVVGDSVWDLLAAQRAGALGIGVLSGGYGREELELCSAFRVYEDPADLLQHIDELGVRDIA